MPSTDQVPRHLMLFDGDCGICSQSARLSTRVDGGRQFDVVPFQSFSEQELNALGLSTELCSEYLRVVTADGRIYSGAMAVNYFLLQQFPWSILVALIYFVTPILYAEMLVYHFVAAHRTRVSTLLGLQACSVGAGDVARSEGESGLVNFPIVDEPE